MNISTNTKLSAPKHESTPEGSSASKRESTSENASTCKRESASENLLTSHQVSMPENLPTSKRAITRIKDTLAEHQLASRVALLPISVLLGYIFVESTWNANAFSMETGLIGANLLLLAFVFVCFYFLGQRSKASIIAFWTICLALGIAEYYVISFRGQPVVPADLLALETAGDVAAGYSYAPSARMVASILIYLGSCVSLLVIPKIKITAKLAISSLVAGILFLSGFCWYMKEGDIKADFDIIVGEWNTLWYYENQGTTLCFLQRVQELFPDAPTVYSSAELNDLLATQNGANATALAEYQLAASTNEENSGTACEQLPNVLIVMNESFSDLSIFESLEGAAAYPAAFYEIAEESLVSGTAYASCFGAGTCNSEFEVLTGASMGNMGEDVYPYVLYDLSGNENLASYFNMLGYETTAMHPAEAKNWRRDRVYPQLGFDEFLSAKDFSGAEKLRWFVTDKETYDSALTIIKENDEPQFILDITIQNHGGYTSGLIPEEDHYSTPINGAEYADLNEYVSLVQRSDADLAYLIEQLETLDEPVVVLFFGDHQPSLADTPETELYGNTLEESSLEEIQKRYEVPYLIWANYDTGAEVEHELENTNEDSLERKTLNTSENTNEGNALNTSLNYLGAMLVKECGLPLTSYQQLLLETQETIPAINLNGFMDTNGEWHSFEDAQNTASESNVSDAAEDNPDEAAPDSAHDSNVQRAISEVLNAYAIAQYGNLFDKSSGRGLLIR